MTEWHPGEDELVALSLLDLEPERREVIADHLVRCAECRGAYLAVNDGIQQTLAAAPSIAPPAGFSGRVLAGMAFERPGHVRDVSPRAATGPRSSPARDGVGSPIAETGPRSFLAGDGVGPSTAGSRHGSGARRMSMLLAAAALVGLFAGVGATLLWQGLAPADVRPQSALAAALVTGSGETVGSVSRTRVGGQEYLLVSVTAGRPNMTYECVMVGSDGSRTSGGTWTLGPASGSGAAAVGTWLVPLPEGAASRVELIAPSGKVWSQAAW